MKQSYKKTNLIVGMLLLVALFAAVVLSSQQQDTQKSAYFSGARLLISPDQIEGNVGNQVLAQLMIDTNNGAKVDFIESKVCYGSQLRLASETPRESINLGDAFTDIMKAKKVDGENCLVLAFKSEKESGELASGMVQVATIRFIANSEGSGTISISKENSQASGFNPNATSTDMSIEVTQVQNTNYQISPADVNPTDSPEPSSGPEPTTPEYPTTPPEPTTPEYPTTPPEPTTPEYPTTPPEPTTPEYPTTPPQPTTPATGNDAVLNFKVAFEKLDKNPMCAQNWPLQITVLSNGVQKTYSNVVANRVGNNEYQGRLVLAGFPYTQNVAVFIKGPKHLQTKYGVNQQQSFYNQSGGEINLTTDDNSPLQVFSDYGLLAGDVVSPAGDAQDGIINGVDFSYVKTKANERIKTDEGGSLIADLDGNCQVNSLDIAILMASLEEKLDQLY